MGFAVGCLRHPETQAHYPDAEDSMNIFLHEVAGTVVQQFQSNDYVNITVLAKQYQTHNGLRRDPNNWLSNKRTKEALECLSAKTGILEQHLYVVIQGGLIQGTWVHPELIPNFNSWLKGLPNNQTEKGIQRRLHQELGGLIEVPTSAGPIDLLTPTQLIEIKNIKGWKDGVGNLMVFAVDYPSHQKRLHLFGSSHTSFWGIVDRYCKPLGILATEEP